MTDQQKKSVEEAAISFADKAIYHTMYDSKIRGFKAGAEEVLNNQEKYGLGTWPVLADKLEILTEENARLREALHYLMEGVRGLPSLTAIAGTLVDHYDKALEVLKGGETK